MRKYHGMRAFAASLALLLLALSAAGCTAAMAPGDAGECGDEVPDLQGELRERIRLLAEGAGELAASIHDMVNREREMRGLGSLQWDEALAHIALSHSRDMAERGYFDHLSPEGRDFADRYTEHGYRLQTRVGDRVYLGGENLALSSVVSSYTYVQDTGEVCEYRYNDLAELARSTVQGWMESPGHRENILSPFTREGIGVCVSDEGEVYITQNVS